MFGDTSEYSEKVRAFFSNHNTEIDMRCKNCGWENSDSSLKCEKCNAPLSAGSSSMPRQEYQNAAGNSNLRGTVSESQMFASQPQAAPEQIPVSGAQTCPECGYPLARGMNVCPMCGTGTSTGAPQAAEQSAKGGVPGRKCNKCSASIPSNSRFCPECGAPVRMGTVNPWMTPQTGSFCTLKPLPWQNEEVEYNPQTYSGDSITLNRANTDPNNQSITSKEQAELICEGGFWYLIDKSELKTTFVHAARKTRLQNGDIIILGNRRFEFKA